MMHVSFARAGVRAGLAAAALLAAGCNRTGPVADATPTPAGPAATVDEPCADDGPRFPITHLCVGRSVNYLDTDNFMVIEAPADCEWVMQESAMPGDDEALIYRALKCKGVTTTLELHGGAHSAALGYAKSALFGDPAPEHEPVRMFPTDPADPQKAIRDLFETIPEAERASCEIQPAGMDGWPKDALVIRPNEAARAKFPKDEPLATCGPFGVDEDSQTFWRISQGFAWFVELGQDTPDFDAGSITIFKKGADGSWAPAP